MRSGNRHWGFEVAITFASGHLHVLCLPSCGDLRGALDCFFQAPGMHCPMNALTTQQFEQSHMVKRKKQLHPFVCFALPKVFCVGVFIFIAKDRGAMCAGGHPQRAAPGACAVTVPAAATSSPPCPRPHAQIDQLPFSQKRLAHPTNAQAPVSYSCLPHPLLHTPGAYSYCRPVSQAPAPRHLPSRACQCESRNRVHANVQTLV